MSASIEGQTDCYGVAYPQGSPQERVPEVLEPPFANDKIKYRTLIKIKKE